MIEVLETFKVRDALFFEDGLKQLARYVQENYYALSSTYMLPNDYDPLATPRVMNIWVDWPIGDETE